MKKLVITVVVALATVTGLAGVSATTGSVIVAEPCCKSTH